MKKLKKIFVFIFNHPIGKKQKVKSLIRFLNWQFKSRIFQGPFKYRFIENSFLLIDKSMAGATGNIYVGLHEFNEMIFLLHLLREGDTFVDLGANIGSYTILASAVAGAKTISVEPVKKTFGHLLNNISENNVSSKVKALNIGVGDKNKFLFFSDKQDTKNHVLSEREENETSVKIEVNTLDNIITQIPVLIKLDIEGYEYFALKGAEKTLKNPNLKAIIIEINNESEKFGISKKETESILLKNGFNPVIYNGFNRHISDFKKEGSDNRIYVRDIDFVINRLKCSKKFNVAGMHV